jgi:hypothetical protein
MTSTTGGAHASLVREKTTRGREKLAKGYTGRRWAGPSWAWRGCVGAVLAWATGKKRPERWSAGGERKRARGEREPKERGRFSFKLFLFSFKNYFVNWFLNSSSKFECKDGERENKIAWLYKIILFIKTWMI